MEEGISSRNTKPNELVIRDNEAYAKTPINLYNVIEFLMTNLEPVRLEDLDPNDRECPICQVEFCVSKDARQSHPPVKTMCGHVFGRPCIIKWLDPLSYWGLKGDADSEILEMETESYDDSRTSCPTCRKVFCPTAVRVPMEHIAAQLWLWDNVYAFAGVARSEKEERSREHLWNYVNYCRSINEFKFDRVMQFKLFEGARDDLAIFAENLGGEALTPVQERLKERLEELGELDVHEMIFEKKDGSQFPYVFHPFSEYGVQEENEEDEEEDEPGGKGEGEENEDEEDEDDEDEEEEDKEDEEDDEEDNEPDPQYAERNLRSTTIFYSLQRS